MYVLFAAVVVLVRAQGAARTGERYQLTCSVTRNDGTILDITWMNSGGLITSNGSGLSLGPQMINGITSSSVLQFNPLAVRHESNYTCQSTFRAMTYSYTFPVLVTASEWHVMSMEDTS